MIELDLFKDQGIPTQEPVVFHHATHGECWITQDPAQPVKTYPNHVTITQCQRSKAAYSLEPIHRSFIVQRNTLEA